MSIEMDLVRSDNGDGGWSLHPDGEDSLVLSGPSECDGDGDWLRPNGADYALAERLHDAGIQGAAREAEGGPIAHKGALYPTASALIEVAGQEAFCARCLGAVEVGRG